MVGFGNDDTSAHFIRSLEPNVFVKFHSINTPDFVMSWIIEVLSSDAIPPVIVLEFAIYESKIHSSSMKAFDFTAKTLAAMGITLIATAGDVGVSVGENLACTYSPIWPASSPYVLSVGVTRLVDGIETSCSRGAGDAITTGGGFSTLYEQPSWQAAVVNNYLANLTSDKYRFSPVPGFNSRGRAYPDISLVGSHIQIIVDGKPQLQSSSVKHL